MLKSKRIAIVLMAGLMSVPSLGLAQEAGVPVDTKGHWAEQVLNKWSASGWLKGSGEGKIWPNRTITRAEVAALVNASFGFNTQSEAVFKDVKPGRWYADAISISAQAGYFQGTPDGYFRPDEPVTRQELAVILTRLLALTPQDPPAQYLDTAKAPAWSKGAVGAMAASGVMIGRASDSFDLTATSTRAETVVVLDRALSKFPSEPGPTDPTPEVPAAVGVTGTVAGSGSEPLPDGVLELTASGGKRHDIQVRGGKFAQELPDGNYAIDSYVIGKTRLKVGVSLTVVSGKSDRELKLTPVANAIGSVTYADGKAWGNGNLVLTQTSPTKQIVEISVVNGLFAGQLENGTYTIGKVEDSSSFIPIMKTLTVSDGKVTDRTVLQLKAPTATNTVQATWADGSALPSVALIVSPQGSDAALFLPIEKGQTKLTLNDGDYVFTGYMLESVQSLVNLKVPFKVKDGKLIPDPAAVLDGRAKADPFTVLLPK
ncbi:S-layer homology domain-containing protein [Paenibacillus methanolicus]|uniref:S-layer family protein n=1 Tax=Paenibacillus methanolicus TaxID=582686 RepID=A0A5S5BP57_9BACL|nr:S-layer homology domain-containing protein [Paenibacillus methanolicus]TYP68975.1 S-layer family protein [Paenibacillus methanolicus]